MQVSRVRGSVVLRRRTGTNGVDKLAGCACLLATSKSTRQVLYVGDSCSQVVGQVFDERRMYSFSMKENRVAVLQTLSAWSAAQSPSALASQSDKRDTPTLTGVQASPTPLEPVSQPASQPASQPTWLPTPTAGLLHVLLTCLPACREESKGHAYF